MRRIRISYDDFPVYMIGSGNMDSTTLRQLPDNAKVFARPKHAQAYAKRFHRNRVCVASTDNMSDDEMLYELAYRCNKLHMRYVWFVKDTIRFFVNRHLSVCQFEEIKNYVRSRIARTTNYYMFNINEGSLVRDSDCDKLVNWVAGDCSLVDVQRIVGSDIRFDMSTEHKERNGFNTLTFTNYGYSRLQYDDR